MNNASYITAAGKNMSAHEAASEMREVDNECASCLYKAAMLTEKDVLEAVITNELTETEQTVIKLHWYKGMSLSQIGSIFGLPRENVRRISERAKNKIYTCMKYIILYDELIDGRKPIPKDFHFKIIRCVDGKELVS